MNPSRARQVPLRLKCGISYLNGHFLHRRVLFQFVVVFVKFRDFNHRHVGGMHGVLFPIAIAFAGFVGDVDPFQIFAISCTSVAGHDATHC